MMVYLLKSTACMALFFAFYKLLLEKENMHVFKRFYLLLSLVASLSIPAIVFTEYVVVESIVYNEESLAGNTQAIIYENIAPEPFNYTPVLWTVYFLGLLFFGFKFIKNLFQIVSRIRTNPKQKTTSLIHVLLIENYPPHTFLNYIFVNKKRFDSNQIPKEVLLHEATHARQMHTIDVIIIELLQVILWFNPLVYVFKKTIKLNHEFLADQAVIEKNGDQIAYKQILLSYLTPKSEPNVKMANSIHYSIKHRFEIMKNKTSKISALLRSLTLIPLVSLLLLGFTQTQIIEVEKKQQLNMSPELNKEQIIEMYITSTEISVNKKVVPLNHLSQAIEKEILPDVALENVSIEGYTEISLDSDLIAELFAELRKTGIKHIKFCSGEQNKEKTRPLENLPQHKLMSQTEYLQLMISKNAIFFYERNRITGVAALELIKQNNLNIFTPGYEQGKTNVFLTKMSLEEFTKNQQKQSPIKILDAPIPKANIQELEADEFERFKNNNEYAVWIDDKPIKNGLLNTYLKNDFVHFFKSYVHKNARSKKFPQKYQVRLYTKSGFEEAFKN